MTLRNYLLAATLGMLLFSAPSDAQICTGIFPLELPEGVYEDELATFGVQSQSASRMRSGDSVFWQFRIGNSFFNRNSFAGSNGTGQIVSFASVVPGNSGFLLAFARVNRTGASCEMGAQILKTPDAGIQSISGIRQFNQVLSFTATVGVDNSRTGSATYNWEFGDGATAQGRTVQHAYATTGTFTVRLTTSDGNRSDTVSQDITISPDPSLPGKPSGVGVRAVGCYSNRTAHYWAWWSAGPGPAPVRYELQNKRSTYYSTIYRGPDRIRRDIGLTSSRFTQLRVRACLSTDSASCGPYSNDTSFYTIECPRSGRGRP